MGRVLCHGEVEDDRSHEGLSSLRILEMKQLRQEEAVSGHRLV